MKDADFWPIARGKTAENNNGCQMMMMSLSHVEKKLSRNKHLNLNLE